MAGKQKNKSTMLRVLKAQSNVLDSIILRQGVIHDTVMNKDWVALEDAMQKMERLSSRFMELEEQRLNIEQDTIIKMRGLDKQEEAEETTSNIEENDIVNADTVNDSISIAQITQEEEPPVKEPLSPNFEERAALYGDRKVSETLTKVRTKLARSKIENNALNAYVNAASGFLKGVFDTIIPQRRNTTYNRYGKMAKPAMQSLVIDRVF